MRQLLLLILQPEEYMSRKSARDCAFKLIFEIPFHDGQTPSDRIEQYFDVCEHKDINAKDKEYISATVTERS